VTEHRKVNLVLPAEISDVFDTLTPDVRDAYIRKLFDLEWTQQSIAVSTGLSRERVRQIINAAPAEDDSAKVEILPAPEPPVRERKAPREYIEPLPENLERMLELKPLAVQVRANSSRYREEAEEYTALIAHEHLERGVPLYRLGKRLGVSHAALRFRLARYGYKLPAEGSSKVYAPIKQENRVMKHLTTALGM
jgi:Sigma-70, region 4